jgi:hypothetical protein
MMAPLQDSTTAAGVVETVNRFTDYLLGYALALAAVGALAMALIELWKKLRDSRARFHATEWTRWVRTSGLDPAQHHPAVSELIRLCTGVGTPEARDAATLLLGAPHEALKPGVFQRTAATALFALDLERMMGAIQDAADVAVASPKRYPALFQLLASGAEDDALAWLENPVMPDDEPVDDEARVAQRRVVKAQSERLARLRQFIRRRLDGFQLYTSDKWASWNQRAANIVGALVMFVALMWMYVGGSAPSIYAILVLTMFGGILSPVAKDLVTALKRVRNG